MTSCRPLLLSSLSLFVNFSDAKIISELFIVFFKTRCVCV